MAASPMFSSAALGRPFVLLPSPALLLTQLRDTPKLAAITPASRLEVRPAPEMVSSGIPELDALTGGWPRGCLSEICGSVSSGRTSVLLAALAQATRRAEACALVDASDALDPTTAAAAGVEMGRLLWIRCGKPVPSSQFSVPSAPRESCLEQVVCWKKSSPQSHPSTSLRAGSDTEKSNTKTKNKVFNEPEFDRKKRGNFEQRLEQVLKITDLLLQSNGFGMIVLDLADIPVQSARRIPMASWFRFRHAVEHTPTVLLVIEQQPIPPHQAKIGLDGAPGLAGSCSSLLLQVLGVRCQVPGKKRAAFSTQHSAGQGLLRIPNDTSNWEISNAREPSCFSHTELLDRFEITAELLRSRLERKPAQSVVNFRSRAKWAG